MMKLVVQDVVLEQITPNAAELIERAGRTCYKSEDKITTESAEKFIRMIVDREHLSVLEHASATFRIICDRGISHELVRHRIASYSQESTRFCNYLKSKFGGEITVIEPPWLPGKDPRAAHVLWQDLCEHAERTYFGLLELGQPPELARSVLTTCLKTEIVMTANFREWLLFLLLRATAKAHPQMQEIAGRICVILEMNCPAVFRPSIVWRSK